AGAVDRQPLLAMGGPGLVEGGGDRGVVGDVDLAEDAADLGGDALAGFFVEIEQGDLDALRRQRPGRALAEARGPARHHRRDRPVEFHGLSPYVVRTLRVPRGLAAMAAKSKPISPEEALDPSRALVPSVQRVDEVRVSRGFWPKLRRTAARIPFADQLLSVWFAARDPE